MTPRTAELIMCVTGLVTLMLRNPAMQMRKPNTPVMVAPQRKVDRGLPPSSSSCTTAVASPERKTSGERSSALRRLL